jgi:hypothetical protein
MNVMPPNNSMHLTALRAAGDRRSVSQREKPRGLTEWRISPTF